MGVSIIQSQVIPIKTKKKKHECWGDFLIGNRKGFRERRKEIRKASRGEYY